MINLVWSRLSKMALMPPMMLILTSLDVIANLLVQILMYSYADRLPAPQHHGLHDVSIFNSSVSIFAEIDSIEQTMN